MKKIFTILCVIPILVISAMPMQVAHADDTTDANARILSDEIVYSILVDRFNNGRQAPSEQVDVDDPLTYNGGDIQGITDRLNQIDEAGFTAISISPIMANAARGYHGYWVEDFYEIEEEFGSLDDLKELIKEAHKREIKVILELDTNYVAESSPLVDEHPDWFKENQVDPIDATEWLHSVVVFDQENPDVLAYLMDVAKFWMDEVDIDGFTLHAADQSNKEFLEALTTEIKQEDPNFYLLATTLQGSDDVESLYDIDNLDGISNPQLFEAMNEVFTKPDMPISDVFETFEAYGDERSILYLDNMNTARFSNNFGDHGRNAITTWNIALGYLYLTPGIPMLYQGSEVPMYGPGFPENQYLVDFSSADPDLEAAFAKMAALKDQFISLKRGDVEEVATDEGLSLFKRSYGKEVVYVAINNDSESRVVTIDGISDEYQLKGLLHDDTIRQNNEGEFLIGMERESSEVFVIRPNSGFNWGFIGFVGGVLILFVVFVVVLSMKQKKRERKNKQ